MVEFLPRDKISKNNVSADAEEIAPSFRQHNSPMLERRLREGEFNEMYRV